MEPILSVLFISSDHKIFDYHILAPKTTIFHNYVKVTMTAFILPTFFEFPITYLMTNLEFCCMIYNSLEKITFFEVVYILDTIPSYTEVPITYDRENVQLNTNLYNL